MSPEFLLIRHAESEWNALGRWQGHGDPPLSGEGRRQAQRLASSLAREAIDVLVASDLRRAIETAEALAQLAGVPVRTDARLRELDVGTWTGLRRDEIEARDAPGLAAFESGDPGFRPGGGESRSQIRARARGAVMELIDGQWGDRIAVVTHLGCIRALVPGAEPANAEVLRIGAAALLHARPAGPGAPASAAAL
jgi:broad specificity phosphatase PhoE